MRGHPAWIRSSMLESVSRRPHRSPGCADNSRWGVFPFGIDLLLPYLSATSGSLSYCGITRLLIAEPQGAASPSIKPESLTCQMLVQGQGLFYSCFPHDHDRTAVHDPHALSYAICTI